MVLVHGIYDSDRSMSRLSRLLGASGWEVCAVRLTPNDASVGLDVLAAQLAAFIADRFPPDRKLDLVGFSMGGLISRYYVQKLGGARRVHRFVTISAPNHGTIWAYLSGRDGCRQMRPNSPFLAELNHNTEDLARVHYTSIYTPLDLTIFPASSSRMPQFPNVIRWALLHPLMVLLPSSLRAVQQALSS